MKNSPNLILSPYYLYYPFPKRASKDGNRSNPAFHLKSGRASKTQFCVALGGERQEIWRTHGDLGSASLGKRKIGNRDS
ncbi:unnamed protein product [Brassica napus]|uniref:(rape) hypothetical protein n=1 Tax=Brassica napus TaxID=3708 RepID=A0A816QGF9_BRANA|nr:unnamed protein product [Brassica napus]